MGFSFITAQQPENLIVPDSIQKAKFAETVEKSLIWIWKKS